VPSLMVDQLPAYPQNIARYHMGAHVQATPKSHPISRLQLNTNSNVPNAAEAALLCDDPTIGYALPVGRTTLLVSLAKIENVSRISFVNSGAKGEVIIATSNAKLKEDSPQWHTALQQDLSPDASVAAVDPGEAKYVRLTFNVSEAGPIYGFAVYATPQVSDFTAPRSRKLPAWDQSDSFALVSYNLAEIHAKARALYISSGADVKQANNMIDGQTTSSHTFAPDDANPTTVIDLGKVSILRRLTAVCAPRSGSMQFYVLRSLPGANPADKASSAETGDSEDSPAPQAAPSTLNLAAAALAELKPIGSVAVDGGRGRAAIDFPATSGRYIMVRWTPDPGEGDGFFLSEISAFGGAGERNSILAANTRIGPSENEASDGKTMLDDKTMLDGKTLLDGKDIPAEGPEEALSPAEGPPPTLPQPPPFTFVPVLIPTSP